MRYPGFLGPSNTNRTVNADSERSINLYPEILDAGTPRARVVQHGTPGLRVFVQMGNAPVRALFSQDGRTFAVAGHGFYELFAGGTAILRSNDLAEDGNPATICSNGTGGLQLFIVSGLVGYTYDLEDNTLTTIADTGFPSPCRMGAFCDGYFIGLLDQSNEFRISSLEDGQDWDGLDVAQRSFSSDNLVSAVVVNRNLWLFGSKHTEPWYNSGDAGFPFQPIGGTQIDQGCAAPFSPAVIDNTVLWLGGDERGQGVVYRADGFTPRRISTLAVERYLNRYQRISDAYSWTYTDEGHAFYVLQIPGPQHADDRDPDGYLTLVYDVSNNLWHDRGLWDSSLGIFLPDLPRCHTFAFGKHLVGDRQSGTVYEMSLRYLTYDVTLADAGL